MATDILEQMITKTNLKYHFKKGERYEAGYE